MGRSILISLAIALTVVVVAAVAWRTVRSPDHEVYPTATVRQLWDWPGSYDGTRVRTQGVVRVFAPGTADEHFVVEAGSYRVGLRGASDAALTPLVGTPFAVAGVLRFEEDFGVALDVEEITPLVGTPTASPATRGSVHHEGPL